LAAGSTEGAAPPGATPPAEPRRRRRALRYTLIAVAIALTVLAAGFLRFVNSLAVAEPPIDKSADAIVVLTGAAFRISDALELLAAGHGQRLLITGVNPGTRSVQILRLMPAHQRWFACCVDLDHSALNTVGNAIETKRWVRGRNFKSLIVVTSNFHMPRAMAELSHQLPDVTLLPFPVISERVRVENWWSSPSSARLLFYEYLKYIVALGRIRLESALDWA
jgi:uncharacterized SAM-binding protein YcdF (DUF218 family)